LCGAAGLGLLAGGVFCAMIVYDSGAAARCGGLRISMGARLVLLGGRFSLRRPRRDRPIRRGWAGGKAGGSGVHSGQPVNSTPGIKWASEHAASYRVAAEAVNRSPPTLASMTT